MSIVPGYTCAKAQNALEVLLSGVNKLLELTMLMHTNAATGTQLMFTIMCEDEMGWNGRTHGGFIQTHTNTHIHTYKRMTK